jgi:predicted nucleic acid-binding protein
MTNDPCYLLDSSALIALLVDGHVHRWRVIDWLEASPKRFGVCSITQGAFLRVYLRAQPGALLEEGQRVLRALSTLRECFFIVDTQNYIDLDPRGIRGYRQVTDGYLVHLATANGIRLATLDEGLAALYPEIAELIQLGPVSR